MDLEADAHMQNNQTYFVKVDVQITEDLINRITDKVEKKLLEAIDNRIYEYFQHDFDINDFTRDMDLDNVTRGIVDEVIEHIKDRL